MPPNQELRNVTENRTAHQGLNPESPRHWVISCPSPRDPEEEEGGSLAEPVTKVAVNFQGLPESLGTARAITGHPPTAEVGEGVCLAKPVTEAAVNL